MKTYLLALTVSAGLALPLSISYAAPQQEAQREAQPAQREQGKREYHFRTQDQAKLREHYRANFKTGDKVDMDHRVHFRAGEKLPEGWRDRLHPVPEVVMQDLPPIPAGMEIGYLDGYAVVYDPAAGEIVEVLDVY
ncbi:MAG TPA: hypothetical protein VKS01_08185 [Bryobacteraceae bacterium]|nr:hypothetical protein [Bryobacteraceae bacterium]